MDTVVNEHEYDDDAYTAAALNCVEEVSEVVNDLMEGRGDGDKHRRGADQRAAQQRRVRRLDASHQDREAARLRRTRFAVFCCLATVYFLFLLIVLRRL